MAYAIRATYWQGTLTCTWMSAEAVLLFPRVISLLLPPLCSWLPPLLSVLPGGALCPAVLRSFFLIHLSATVIAPVVPRFLSWPRSYSIQYRLTQSTG